MMLTAGKLDSSNMRKALLNTVQHGSGSAALKVEYDYHLQNFNQKGALQQNLMHLKRINLRDSIQKLLYPYLPERLRGSSYFPTIFYIPYGSEEATGMGGLVIHDISLSLKADRYRPGLIAAHEAFHSVVSLAFQQNLRQDIDYNSIEFSFFYFLQNVSEEGMADLIDKKILSQKGSPLQQDVFDLMHDENKLARQFIVALDQFLLKASNRKTPFSDFKSYSDLAERFGKNGGHIPGRFMANAIKDSKELSAHIKQVEDPVSFFEAYHRAVRTDKSKPNFSQKSMSFLKEFRNKFQKTQKVLN